MGLVLGIVMATIILALFISSLLIIFILLPFLKNNAINYKYNTIIPNWDCRVNGLAHTKYSKEDLDRALRLFFDKVISIKKYDKKKLKSKISKLKIEFVRAVNEEGRRYIVDQYGRKIAGDHVGEEVRVVVLDGDNLRDTAFFHELGHVAHELKNVYDYEHEDTEMWNDVVGWCKDNF